MMTKPADSGVTHTPVAQFRMVPNLMRVESEFIFMPTLHGCPGASVISGTKQSVCGAGGRGARAAQPCGLLEFSTPLQISPHLGTVRQSGKSPH